MLDPTRPSNSSLPLQSSSESEESEDCEGCLSKFAKWVSVVNVETKQIQKFLPFSEPSRSLSELYADWVERLSMNSLRDLSSMA